MKTDADIIADLKVQVESLQDALISKDEECMELSKVIRAHEQTIERLHQEIAALRKN